ncbi:prepilin-type N-terminal cleavage/methylation domain-containing protein [Halopseudomonas pachastrellae]|nr:prepilin-type N-terminal cleavage/methylation domain-containing protein [Halopseudomonas pachastrellae]
MKAGRGLTVMRKAMKFSRSAGFTIVEVMIVVAIVGILAAIAYPSYQEHIRNTRERRLRV